MVDNFAGFYLETCSGLGPTLAAGPCEPEKNWAAPDSTVVAHGGFRNSMEALAAFAADQPIRAGCPPRPGRALELGTVSLAGGQQGRLPLLCAGLSRCCRRF